MDAFVDEVAHLIRSQIAAGIFRQPDAGRPGVLLIQLAAQAAFGAAGGAQQAEYVLHRPDLLGPTALYAAFTGVLLFASSIIAGWAWRTGSSGAGLIARSPGTRVRSRCSAPRARSAGRPGGGQRLSLAANVSLGLMLGLVPAIAGFFAFAAAGGAPRHAVHWPARRRAGRAGFWAAARERILVVHGRHRASPACST